MKLEGFFALIRKTRGCWKWLGGHDVYGYAQASVHKHTRKAHRLIYEQLVGPIPPGMSIGHLCCDKACLNPAHMEVVTMGENARRRGARQTHCKRGHDLKDAYLWSYDGGVKRKCRVCITINYRKRAARNDRQSHA